MAGNGLTAHRLLRCMLLPDQFLRSPRRVKHFAAMVLIGDGVMALVHPSKDAHAWSKGPQVWRKLMQELARRPVLTRAIGVAQVAWGCVVGAAAEPRAVARNVGGDQGWDHSDLSSVK